MHAPAQLKPAICDSRKSHAIAQPSTACHHGGDPILHFAKALVNARTFEPALVTLAITTHNRCDLLQRALAGALAQTWPYLEILVSDDASSDGTQAFMATVHDPRIRYLRITTPSGIAGNFQNALDHARGEFFLILNDDDELEPDAVETLANCFLHPAAPHSPEQITLSWCPCKIQDRDRAVRYVTDAGPAVEPGIDLVTGLFDGTRGPRFCGVMVRTHLAVQIGYSRSHGPIPDVGNWTRLAMRPGLASCAATPVARYTAHNDSCTGTSTAQSWQVAGEAIIRDLLSDLKQLDEPQKARRIRRSRRNFITGLLAAVLMQSANRPGWALRAAKEFVRAPQYFLTPMTFRRVAFESGKLFRKAR